MVNVGKYLYRMLTEVARTFLPIDAAAGRLQKDVTDVFAMIEDGTLDTLEQFGQLWVAQDDVDYHARRNRS